MNNHPLTPEDAKKAVIEATASSEDDIPAALRRARLLLAAKILAQPRSD